MSSSLLDKQRARFKLPQNEVVRLALAFAALWNLKWHQCIFLCSFDRGFASSCVVPLQLYITACGIGYAGEKLTEVVGNSVSYPFTSLLLYS